MNLHGIVRGAITSVNPDITAALSTSTGYTTLPSGAQVPTYSTDAVQAQIQANTFKDLQQIDAVNQNGEMRSAYLFGVSHGVVRSLQKGGDFLTFLDEDGVYSEWLVTKVLEIWPDWCKVAITLQN